MDRELIIQALKSTCGNKNFRFQVLEQNSKLHIYVNHKTDKHPDYLLLTDLVTKAIASLPLDSWKGVWLYSRKLGDIEPKWQTYVEFPLKINSDDLNTFANSQEGNTDRVSNPGIVYQTPLPEVNIFAPKLTEAIEIIDDSESLVEQDSTGNTDLLDKTGMIHKAFLPEEEIDTFAHRLIEETDTTDSDKINLTQYCFITNQKLLTSDILAPDKDTIRLVKFFHHLSDNNKQKILPALDNYFKLAKIPDTDKLSVALQNWLKQIAELDDEHRRTAEIWLSRYCFDRDATLNEFKTVADKNAVITAKKKKTQSNTEYNFTPAIPDSSNGDDFHQQKFKLSSVIRKFILPFIWTLATLIFLILGIYTTNLPTTSQAIPSICNSTIGSPNYCRLAVNLAGEKAIKQSSSGIFPLTKITETSANYGCQRYANVKAGIVGNIDPRQIPVVSSSEAKILPRIYVVEAQQKNVGQSDNVRVGCVYAAGQTERSPKLLAADIIPNNWPREHYQPHPKSGSNISFGFYTNIVNLGLYTIFYAIGIAIASKLNLGIKINQIQTIYLVAVILAMVQLFVGKLPVFNLIASTMLPTLAVLSLSMVIKDFKIDRSYGYPLVATGILVIIAVQFLLYGVFLGLV